MMGLDDEELEVEEVGEVVEVPEVPPTGEPAVTEGYFDMTKFYCCGMFDGPGFAESQIVDFDETYPDEGHDPWSEGAPETLPEALPARDAVTSPEPSPKIPKNDAVYGHLASLYEGTPKKEVPPAPPATPTSSSKAPRDSKPSPIIRLLKSLSNSRINAVDLPEED